MRISRPLLVSVFALLLVGAGCAAPAAPAANAPEANRPAVNVPAANDNTNAPVPTAGVRDLPAATGVDDSWQTYTNPALGFTFQTPTKGRYAPTWEVRFLGADDADVEGGCFIAAQNAAVEADRLRVNGVEFCRTEAREGTAGSLYLTHHVTTTKGTRVILISFTKKAVNAGMLDCPTPPESGLSVSGTACVPFDLAAYDAEIENIVATFRYAQ